MPKLENTLTTHNLKENQWDIPTRSLRVGIEELWESSLLNEFTSGA